MVHSRDLQAWASDTIQHWSIQWQQLTCMQTTETNIERVMRSLGQSGKLNHDDGKHWHSTLVMLIARRWRWIRLGTRVATKTCAVRMTGFSFTTQSSMRVHHVSIVHQKDSPFATITLQQALELGNQHLSSLSLATWLPDILHWMRRI